jgi:hypothetical protein
MPKRTNRTVQVMSIAEYCHNKQARENFTFLISDGVGRYSCGTTQEEIDGMYPVPQHDKRRM